MIMMFYLNYFFLDQTRNRTCFHFSLSPEVNCDSGARWGPLDSLSILFEVGERKWTISILI